MSTAAVPSEPTVGDTLEAAARALEALGDMLRRLAEREVEFAELCKLAPSRDRNLAEAADELRVSTPVVKRLIVTGQLKGYKSGTRTWRVPGAEIERYRQRRQKQMAVKGAP